MSFIRALRHLTSGNKTSKETRNKSHPALTPVPLGMAVTLSSL